jgi:hypothetical protein
VLAQPLEARDPVELRHAQVEQHDVRFRLADGRNDVAADGDLSDDLESLGARERTANSRQHQPMVVCH